MHNYLSVPFIVMLAHTSATGCAGSASGGDNSPMPPQSAPQDLSSKCGEISLAAQPGYKLGRTTGYISTARLLGGNFLVAYNLRADIPGPYRMRLYDPAGKLLAPESQVAEANLELNFSPAGNGGAVGNGSIIRNQGGTEVHDYFSARFDATGKITATRPWPKHLELNRFRTVFTPALQPDLDYYAIERPDGTFDRWIIEWGTVALDGTLSKLGEKTIAVTNLQVTGAFVEDGDLKLLLTYYAAGSKVVIFNTRDQREEVTVGETRDYYAHVQNVVAVFGDGTRAIQWWEYDTMTRTDTIHVAYYHGQILRQVALPIGIWSATAVSDHADFLVLFKEPGLRSARLACVDQHGIVQVRAEATIDLAALATVDFPTVYYLAFFIPNTVLDGRAVFWTDRASDSSHDQGIRFVGDPPIK